MHPTQSPSSNPTFTPTHSPSINPTLEPTEDPSLQPTNEPSPVPTPFACFHFGADNCPETCVFNGLRCSPSCDTYADVTARTDAQAYLVLALTFNACEERCIADFTCGWFSCDGNECSLYEKGTMFETIDSSTSGVPNAHFEIVFKNLFMCAEEDFTVYT